MIKRLLLGVVACCLFSVSFSPVANASDELKPVSCEVSIDYLVNSTLRFPYQKSIVVQPGLTFEDDFSTVIRFRYLTASTRLEGEDTIVSIFYYNDVGVFDFIDFRTDIKLKSGKPGETTGRSSYFTSIGSPGERITAYNISCERLKN